MFKLRNGLSENHVQFGLGQFVFADWPARREQDVSRLLRAGIIRMVETQSGPKLLKVFVLQRRPGTKHLVLKRNLQSLQNRQALDVVHY